MENPKITPPPLVLQWSRGKSRQFGSIRSAGHYLRIIEQGMIFASPPGLRAHRCQFSWSMYWPQMYCLLQINAICVQCNVNCNFPDGCYHLVRLQHYWDLSRVLSLVAASNNERAQWLTNNEYGRGGPESNKANGLAICRIADLSSSKPLPRESALLEGGTFNLM